MKSAREKGFEGEQLAAKFLKANGYRILERNYRTKSGEIDIIARKNRSIVFIEVKTRSNDSFGSPVEAVDRRKLAKLEIVANQYIQKKEIEDAAFRFEVITITKINNAWQCEIIPVD